MYYLCVDIIWKNGKCYWCKQTEITSKVNVCIENGYFLFDVAYTKSFSTGAGYVINVVAAIKNNNC